jgi:1-acyl-sn-glycerol-3-phosphate acyltransferase
LDGPVILAANHTSELDVTAVPLLLGFMSALYPVYFVSSKKGTFTNSGWRNYVYGGFFFKILGGYPKYSGQKDYSYALSDFMNLLNKRQTIFIFPEGKMTQDGKLNPVHGGLGYMVHKTHTTVVPVAIDTFYNITLKDYFLRKRKVKIQILKPMFARELIRNSEPRVEDYRGISELVMNEIKEVLY